MIGQNMRRSVIWCYLKFPGFHKETDVSGLLSFETRWARREVRINLREYCVAFIATRVLRTLVALNARIVVSVSLILYIARYRFTPLTCSCERAMTGCDT